MSGPFGIRLKLGHGEEAIHVWTGWGVQSYAFRDPDDARAFIDENWTGFDARWRAAHLSVAPLPPWIAVCAERMLHYGRPA
jgi:hypothetical protein